MDALDRLCNTPDHIIALDVSLETKRVMEWSLITRRGGATKQERGVEGK